MSATGSCIQSHPCMQSHLTPLSDLLLSRPLESRKNEPVSFSEYSPPADDSQVRFVMYLAVNGFPSTWLPKTGDAKARLVGLSICPRTLVMRKDSKTIARYIHSLLILSGSALRAAKTILHSWPRPSGLSLVTAGTARRHCQQAFKTDPLAGI